LIAFLWIPFSAFLVAARRSVDKKYFIISIPLLMIFLIESYSDNMLYYLVDNWYFWFVFGTFLSYFLGRGRRVHANPVDQVDRVGWMRARLEGARPGRI
jgi:hypothetical protein